MGYPLTQGSKAWQDKTVPNLSGGINTSKRSDELEDNQCLTLSNVLIRNKEILSDNGYKPFGSVVVGTPQATYQFYKKSGASEEMLVTTATVYKYSTTILKWLLVKGTKSTTTTAGYAAGVTVIVVADATGFSTGDLVGIALDDGSQLQTTITVAGTTFTLANAIPVGRSVNNGAVVLRAVVLTGDLDDQVVPVTLASHDWFVFTNGVNIVKRYDGTDCIDVPGLPGSNVICMAVCVYNAALFLLNTIESGSSFPQRVRRSNQGDPTDWIGGSAGYDDLYDSSDNIQTGVVLGPYIIVYRERSISRGQFVGSGGISYSYDTMVTGDGSISANGIIDIGDYHIVIGNANIYEYRGGFELAPIGDAIFYRMYSTQGDLSPQYKSSVFGFYVEELDEAWVFYPSTGSQSPDKLLRYSVGEEVWYTRDFADAFVGFGFYQIDNTKTWADLVGSWVDQTWKWNAKATLSQSPTTHLCLASGNQVMEYDYVSTLDNATAIAYTIETKDFALADTEFRFDLLRLYMQGTGILIEYSTDRGASWNTMTTVTSSTVQKINIGKQFVANTVRFRISGNSPDFRLRWLYFLFKLESLFG